MAGTYTLANNTTLTDGQGGNGAIVNLTGKYADAVTNQNNNADNEIFYQGLFSLSVNTNRRANRENSLLLDTTTAGANTITDVAGHVLQMWVFIPFYPFHGLGFNVAAWAGVQVVVADGGTSGTANINTYRVDGNDNNVKGGWQLYVVDLRNTPTGADSNLSRATLGDPGRAPRYVGWTHSSRGFTIRRDPLCALDCARFGRMQLNVTGGTNTSILPSDPENSSAANFMQMSDYDDYNAGGTPANGSAVDGGYHKFGICEPSSDGNGYILRGVWSLGTSATATFFEDYNSTINVRDEFLTYADFNRIEVRNASSTVNLINTNGALVIRNDIVTAVNTAYAPAQPRGNFEMVDNATVAMTGCTWSDMGTFIFQSNATVADTTFRRTDLVTQGGATITDSTFANSIAATSLLSNSLADVSACTFVSDGSNHAIELTTVPATYTWNHTTTGYATGSLGVEGTDFTAGSTGNETFYINATSSQNITVTIPSGITTPSIRRGASYTGVITIEAQAKTIDVNVKDEDGVNVSGAFVWINDGVTTIFNGTTDASGNIAQQSYSGTNNATLRVRKFGDKPFETTLGTASGSVSQLVTLINDSQQVAVPTLNQTYTINTTAFTITVSGGSGSVVHTDYTTLDTAQNLYEFVMNTFAATAFMEFSEPLESITNNQYNFINSYTFGAKDIDYKYIYDGSFTDADNNLLWSNVKTIGSLQSGTGIYIVQGVEASDAALTSWWPDGNLNVLVKVQDGTFIQSTDDTATNVDGSVWLFTREYGDLYDHSFIDLSNGGQNIVALSTQSDLNNQTASGTVAAYSIGTITFGSTSQDIGDGNGNQPYKVIVDCNSRPLSEVYEYLKYITSFDFSITVNGDDGFEYRNADEANYTAVDNRQAPFGTFAGGKFFGAKGVFLSNVPNADAENYELIDDNGVTRLPPVAAVQFQLTGMKDGTEVRIFQTSNSAAIAGVENMTGGADVGTTATSGVIVSGSTDNNTFSFEYTFAQAPTNGSNLGIYIAIINNQYEYINLSGLTLTALSSSVPVQQRFDRNFINP